MAISKPTFDCQLLSFSLVETLLFSRDVTMSDIIACRLYFMHSAVLAQLGLKAAALAWLEAAWAFSTHRLGQSHQPGPGLGLAQPRPWLLYVKCSNFAHRSIGCTGS